MEYVEGLNLAIEKVSNIKILGNDSSVFKKLEKFELKEYNQDINNFKLSYEAFSYNISHDILVPIFTIYKIPKMRDNEEEVFNTLTQNLEYAYFKSENNTDNSKVKAIEEFSEILNNASKIHLSNFFVLLVEHRVADFTYNKYDFYEAYMFSKESSYNMVLESTLFQ